MSEAINTVHRACLSSSSNSTALLTPFYHLIHLPVKHVNHIIVCANRHAITDKPWLELVLKYLSMKR